ncbi:methyl-accepting chemotaxis protein [Tropicibacter sp. S64]|uniref:methyl-accepting chemotaxis protein n=1 Tax=Tropicibacter sp. S64 TaxID=3415122 RepID=UPI003C7AA809
MTTEQSTTSANEKIGGNVPALKSVFVRSAAIMAVTTIVVAGVMAMQSARLADSLARSGIVARAAAAADNTSGTLAAPMRFKAAAKIEEEVQTAFAAGGEDIVGILVVDAAGNIVTEVMGEGAPGETLAEVARNALNADTTLVEGDGLLTARAVRAAPDQPPLGVVAFAYSDAHALALVAGDKRAIVLWAAGIFIGMMVLTIVLLRRFLGRPLNELSDTIAGVARGDYDRDVGLATRQDEIGRIARHLDSLMERLRAARMAEAEQVQKLDAQVTVVRHLGDGLNALAEGILNHQIDEVFAGEYEALRQNYNRAVQTLRTAIANVSENAGNILSSANEIARASDDLSQRTETQAATLEETAAALEQMLATVQTAASRAKDVNVSVRTVRETALSNGEVMQEAVGAMGAIEKSSEKIVEIITVIDDIAFQTNLLALNAGVEAARAGESGKGFAVVASEVRGLAQRSAEAARQIKDLIDDSAGRVKDGVDLVQRAGVALEDVVGQVATISDLMAEIAAGAGEQADGLNEINTGVTNLDRVTQQNAAMVEETSAAAHMLREDANEMSAVVGKFRVGTDADRAVAVKKDGPAATPKKTAPGRLIDDAA